MSNEPRQAIGPAPLGRRVAAILIDLAIVYLLIAAPQWITPENDRATVGVLFAGIYFVTRDSLWGGRSAGKRMVGLRVLNAKSLVPAGMKESFKRNGLFLSCCFLLLLLEIIVGGIAKILPFGTVSRVGLVGASWYCFHYVEKEKRRTKMDMFGDTVVVTLHAKKA